MVHDRRRHRNWFLVTCGLATAIVPSALLFMAVNLLFVVPLAFGLLVVVLGLVGDVEPLNPARRRRKSIGALTLCVLGVLGPFGLTWQLNRPRIPVHLVVPAGFRGGFKLLLDEQAGLVLREQGGRINVTIPNSGILHVRSFAPFEWWHSQTAAFSDGSRLPSEHEVGPGFVALRGGASGSCSGGGAPSETYTWWFIGTEQEFKAAYGKLPDLIGSIINASSR